ncbi:hypothetical protein ABK040_005580 [Willaertia magna]
MLSHKSMLFNQSFKYNSFIKSILTQTIQKRTMKKKLFILEHPSSIDKLFIIPTTNQGRKISMNALMDDIHDSILTNEVYKTLDQKKIDLHLNYPKEYHQRVNEIIVEQSKNRMEHLDASSIDSLFIEANGGNAVSGVENNGKQQQQVPVTKNKQLLNSVRFIPKVKRVQEEEGIMMKIGNNTTTTNSSVKSGIVKSASGDLKILTKMESSKSSSTTAASTTTDKKDEE